MKNTAAHEHRRSRGHCAAGPPDASVAAQYVAAPSRADGPTLHRRIGDFKRCGGASEGVRHGQAAPPEALAPRLYARQRLTPEMLRGSDGLEGGELVGPALPVTVPCGIRQGSIASSAPRALKVRHLAFVPPLSMPDAPAGDRLEQGCLLRPAFARQLRTLARSEAISGGPCSSPLPK